MGELGSGWLEFVGIGAMLCVCTFLRAIVFGYVSVRLSVRGYSPVCNCACDFPCCSNRVATPPCMSRARMTTWLCCVSWLLPEQP